MKNEKEINNEIARLTILFKRKAEQFDKTTKQENDNLNNLGDFVSNMRTLNDKREALQWVLE